MKILFVDIQYDYGDPKRGPNLIGDGFKRAIEALGHSVVPFYYDDDLTGSPALQKRLLDAADHERPDLITFCLFRDQFKTETLKQLSSRYRTINWFGDDTWRFDGFSSVFGPCFTDVVTTDQFSIQKYRALGVKNVHYSQWAAIDTEGKSVWDGKYDFDVTFVGQFHPFRDWFCSQLRKRGLAVECFGRGWKNGPVSAVEMNRIFATSKISLNLSNSVSFDARYLMTHPRALAYALKSKKNRSQIKARNFEIPFFGGFQLTEYVPGLEAHLEIGTELVCYKDVDDAELLARHYLENDSEREKIREAGYVSAIQRHGYIHRWEQILGAMAR